MARLKVGSDLRQYLGQTLGSRTVRNVGVVYAGKLGEAAIRFAAGVLMTRALGPARLGILVTIVTVASIAGTCMVFGLHSTATKFVADARKGGSGDDPTVMKAVGMVFGAAMLLTALATWLGAPWIAEYLLGDPGQTPLVRLGVALAMVNSMSMLGAALVRGYERFAGLVAANIVGQSLRLALIAAVIGWGVWLYWQAQVGQVPLDGSLLEHSMLDEMDMLIANMLGATIIVAGDLLLIRGALLQAVAADSRRARAKATQLVGYSWWIFLSALIGIGYQMFNVLILQAMKTAEVVGHFSAAINLLKPFEFFPESINQVILPKVSEIRSRRHFLATARKIMLAGVVLALPIVPLALFPAPILLFLFGEKYLPAAPVVMVVSIHMVLNIVFNPFYALLHRLNIPRAFMTLGIVSSVGNILFNILLIPAYGATGSALATLIAYIIAMTYLLITIFRRASRMDWEEA